MSLPGAVYDLSIPDLLHLLNEKITLECTRVREIGPPPAVSTASLESEIESLEIGTRDTLRFLLSLRNTLRPVNRLPPEILSRIAGCSLGEYADDARSIIPLTRVCRYWRESIISAPENWTLVSNNRIQLAKLSLERAKAAHLRIYLRMELPRDFPDVLDTLIPHLKNTETLTASSIPTFEKLVQLFSKFPRPMRNLRSLTLELDDTDDLDTSIDPFEWLPHTLKALTLDEIHLSPSLLELRALTDLTLNISEFGLPLDALLDFLEGNRLLKRADLRIYVFHRTPPTDHGVRPHSETNFNSCG